MRPYLLLAACTLSGCATIFRGTYEPVRFASEPPGAQVELAFKPTTERPNWCRTPCELKVPRSGKPTPYTVTITGLEPVSAELMPASEWGAMGVVVFFDTIFLFPFGLVDYIGSAAYTYPEAIGVTLPAEGLAPRIVVTR